MDFNSSSDDEQAGTPGGRNRASRGEMARQNSGYQRQKTPLLKAAAGDGCDRLRSVRAVGRRHSPAAENDARNPVDEGDWKMGSNDARRVVW